MADLSHLERMGTELKCPICLSILNSAVSITCNHVFCNLCINKSMKLGPNCPVCKLPYQRREIRSAPHMDNLVTIYKSMESALGIDIFGTQNTKSSKPPAMESKIDGNQTSASKVNGESRYPKYKRKQRGKMHKTTSLPKLVHDPDALKPSFPNKKRIHVPQNPLSESPLAAKIYENMKSFNEEGSQKKPWLSKEAELVLSPFFWLKENMDPEVSSQQTDDEEFYMNESPATFSDIEDLHDELGGLNNKSDAGDCFDNGLLELTHQACSPDLCLSPLGTQVEDSDLEAGFNLNMDGGGLTSNIGSASDKSLLGKRKCRKRAQKTGKNIKEKSKKDRNQVDETNTVVDIVLDSMVDEKIDKNASENPCKSTKRCSEIARCDESMMQLKTKKTRRSCDNLKKNSTMNATPCDTSAIIITNDISLSQCFPPVVGGTDIETHDDRRELKNYGGRTKPTDKSRVCFRDISNVDDIISDRIQEKHVKNMIHDAKENTHDGCFSSKDERGSRTFPILQKCTSIRRPIPCAFCNSLVNSEISGEMVHYLDGVPVELGGNEVKKIISSHKCCAEWAPNVYFDGENAVNLSSELARSRHIKCNLCGEKGAALGCFERSCRRSFHFPCAKKVTECRWDTDNFVMLCPLHSSLNLPSENPPSRQKQSKKFSPKGVSPRSELGRDGTTTTAGWYSGSTNKLVISCSAVTPREKEMVMEFAKMSGCLVVKKWDKKITHVIASTNDKGECRRTMKFMMGILHGKWILTMDWIEACTEAMKFVQEEPFEVTCDVHGIRNGPISGRLRRLHKEGGIFEGRRFYLYGEEKSGGYKGCVEEVIRAGGGMLVCRKPVVVDGVDSFVVYNSSGEEEHVCMAKLLADSCGAIPVSNTWIFHSISASSLQPPPLLS